MTSPVWYELRNAVYAKQFEVAEALLRAAPALVNLRNGIGETVLHFLAVEDDLEGVSWLHSNGFDIDTKNEFGTPAFFEVAQLGYEGLLHWFLQSGVNVHATNCEGMGILAFLGEEEDAPMRNILLSHSPELAFA